jgi:hypothetical protein
MNLQKIHSVPRAVKEFTFTALRALGCEHRPEERTCLHTTLLTFHLRRLIHAAKLSKPIRTRQDILKKHDIYQENQVVSPIKAFAGLRSDHI